MIEVYTDGGSRGNPGDSACAFVVVKNKVEIETQNFYLGTKTNNQAEYEGLIKGLEYIVKNNISEVKFYSDSELMVKQIMKLYRVKDEGLKTLYDKAGSLISRIKNFQIVHVRREFNKKAYLLVNQCLDEK
jgi:ribonuclease HI